MQLIAGMHCSTILYKHEANWFVCTHDNGTFIVLEDILFIISSFYLQIYMDHELNEPPTTDSLLVIV